MTTRLLGALLGKLKDRHKAFSDELAAELTDLPVAIQEKLWQAIYQYPSEVSLHQLVKQPLITGQDGRAVVHHAAEALRPQPPMEWIAEEFIAPETLVQLVGASGSAKTYLAMDLAVCVALGKEWAGFRTKQTKVLFIDEESGIRRFKRRLAEVIRARGGDETIPLSFITLARFNLRDPQDLALLQSKVEETGAGLVILDALIDVIPGADENASKDMQPVLQALSDMSKATGAAFLVIHHTNKAGGYRGSSAMPGVVDLMILMTKEAKSPRIFLKSEKTRDIEPFEFWIEVHFEGEQVWFSRIETGTPEPSGPAGEAYVIQFLSTHGPMTLQEIEANVPETIKPRTATNAVYSLVNKGIISRVNPQERGRGAKAVYALIDQEEPGIE